MRPAWNLERDAYGALVFTKDGERHVGVIPVRAFPISAGDEGIALVGREGRELAWIDRLEELEPPLRSLIAQELGRREFMPTIQAILEVSAYATPSHWRIRTDRGETTLTLQGEEDIRRLGGQSLLIADAQGVNYLLRDLSTLDRRSRRILDRFL
jgi:hypothetical protein